MEVNVTERNGQTHSIERVSSLRLIKGNLLVWIKDNHDPVAFNLPEQVEVVDVHVPGYNDTYGKNLE